MVGPEGRRMFSVSVHGYMLFIMLFISTGETSAGKRPGQPGVCDKCRCITAREDFFLSFSSRDTFSLITISLTPDGAR